MRDTETERVVATRDNYRVQEGCWNCRYNMNHVEGDAQIIVSPCMLRGIERSPVGICDKQEK